MIRKIARLLGLVSGEAEVPAQDKAEVRRVLDQAHQEVSKSRRARRRALELEYELVTRRRRQR